MSRYRSELGKEMENEQKVTLTLFSLRHKTISLTLMINQELNIGSHLYKYNNDDNVH